METALHTVTKFKLNDRATISVLVTTYDKTDHEHDESQLLC